MEAATSLLQQAAAAAGPRSSGFLDDLSPPQQPESLGLPQPADESDDDGEFARCVGFDRYEACAVAGVE